MWLGVLVLLAVLLSFLLHVVDQLLLCGFPMQPMLASRCVE